MPGGRREASEDDDGGRGRGIHDPWSQVRSEDIAPSESHPQPED